MEKHSSTPVRKKKRRPGVGSRILFSVALTVVIVICATAAIYVAMGWAVVTRPDALANMPIPVIALIAAGGVSYSVGAVIYVLKKPNLSPQWGFHEIFHLLILLGSALMVTAVFLFL